MDTSSVFELVRLFFAHWWTAFKAIGSDLGWLANYLQVISGLLVVVLVIWLPFRRSVRLVAHVCFLDFGRGRRQVRAVFTVLHCTYYVLRTFSVWEAVRLRVEVETLYPRPLRPSKVLAGDGYADEFELFKRERRRWRGRVRRLLNELASEVRSPNRKPTIPVDNCFILQRAAEEAIPRYFKVLNSTREHDTRFRARVHVKTGFVAPLHLLGGLVNHFDKEWPPMIREYGRAVARPGDALDRFVRPQAAATRDLRHRQAFLFYCWLLWGPSISLCSCELWRGGMKALQFGYGDEANSVPLLIPTDDKLAELIRLFGSDAIRGGGEERGRLAIQLSVTSVPRWSKDIPRADICTAQQSVLDPSEYGVVLEYASHTVTGGLAEDRESRYYSAYLWVMFVLEDDAGRSVAEEAWANMLPFFEHSNVGEAGSYAFLRETLARKALGSIARLAEETPPDGRRPTLYFRYACAVDEGGCGSPLLVARTRTIRAQIQDLLDRDPAFASLRASGRLSMDPPPSGEYAACHLPDVIARYLQSLPGQLEDENTRSATLVHRTLEDGDEDRQLLRRFYDEIYVSEFPDENERESLENLDDYLRAASPDCRHHILLLMSGEAPVAGAIIDYLTRCNTGVLEFLVVAKGWRGRGIGAGLREWCERVVAADALRETGRGPDFILAEIEDPFRVDAVPDVDTFARAELWGRWGYRRLDFPYVQPALGPGKAPIRHLMLAVKPMRSDLTEAVPSDMLKLALHEYIRLAMRIERPETCAQYQEMLPYLEAHPTIATGSMSAYLGRADVAPFHVHEIRGEADPDLDELLAFYTNAFAPGPTVAGTDAFRQRVAAPSGLDFAYHLWSVRERPGADIAGMAAFLTLLAPSVDPEPDPALPTAVGFGGYVALGPPIRGTGRFRALLARIEERMVRDGLGARGWYIESAPEGVERDVFARMGFSAVPIDYRQPPLHGRPETEAPRLALMYKPFGAVYAPAAPTKRQWRAAVAAIFRVVYGLKEPLDSSLFPR